MALSFEPPSAGTPSDTNTIPCRRPEIIDLSSLAAIPPIFSDVRGPQRRVHARRIAAAEEHEDDRLAAIQDVGPFILRRYGLIRPRRMTQNLVRSKSRLARITRRGK